MDPNQYNWQVYLNLLQNYQFSPTNENSQDPSFFPFPPPPMNFMPNNYQYPSTKNSQNSQTFPSIPLPLNNSTVLLALATFFRL